MPNCSVGLRQSGADAPCRSSKYCGNGPGAGCVTSAARARRLCAWGNDAAVTSTSLAVHTQPPGLRTTKLSASSYNVCGSARKAPAGTKAPMSPSLSAGHGIASEPRHSKIGAVWSSGAGGVGGAARGPPCMRKRSRCAMQLCFAAPFARIQTQRRTLHCSWSAAWQMVMCKGASVAETSAAASRDVSALLSTRSHMGTKA
mmetsp:Transcript_93984/g.265397  ORF Transcript_93984/g.265397 Transcript_93984/m.265397 type:complete len:201 (+) Transcript_93984:769-1371(+)